MPSITSTNGQTLNSTALTPQNVMALFQSIVAKILGLDTTQPLNSPTWLAVRTSWQQQGQPAWTIDQDVCFVAAYSENPPFGQWLDRLDNSTPDQTGNLVRQMAYTQVWRVHFTLYGPNCMANSGLIASALSLAWVHDLVEASNLYVIPRWNRPIWAPENKDSQWWPRCDFELRYNENVQQTVNLPSFDGAEVELITDTGLTETVSIKH